MRGTKWATYIIAMLISNFSSLYAQKVEIGIVADFNVISRENHSNTLLDIIDLEDTTIGCTILFEHLAIMFPRSPI